MIKIKSFGVITEGLVAVCSRGNTQKTYIDYLRKLILLLRLKYWSFNKMILLLGLKYWSFKKMILLLGLKYWSFKKMIAFRIKILIIIINICFLCISSWTHRYQPFCNYTEWFNLKCNLFVTEKSGPKILFIWFTSSSTVFRYYSADSSFETWTILNNLHVPV
jgi:hypothetical protein